jgi:hypothetical protein
MISKPVMDPYSSFAGWFFTPEATKEAREIYPQSYSQRGKSVFEDLSV